MADKKIDIAALRAKASSSGLAVQDLRWATDNTLNRGDEGRSYGLVFAQRFDAYNLHLYGGIRRYKYDTKAQNLRDIDNIMFGALLFFDGGTELR